MNGHFKLQRIHKPFLAAAHLVKLLCKRFFALRYNVLGCRFLRFFKVNGCACGFFHVARHLLRDFFIFADEVRRVAKLMAFRVPEKVQ